MISHLFFPGLELKKLTLLTEHNIWLTQWLQNLEPFLDSGDVASSMCLEGALSEIILYGELRTDWLGIMDEFLTSEDGSPLSYSENYSKRLYNFNQWNQVTVHSIHTRWWLERAVRGTSSNNLEMFMGKFIQNDGWIYNPAVSPTNLKTRMRSEIFMSLAMATEIFYEEGTLEDKRAKIEANASSMSLTNYVSAEFFRVLCLSILESPELIPQDLGTAILDCTADEGFCDFCLMNKKDDYMGSAKRSSRDSEMHSAFTTLQSAFLAGFIKDERRDQILQKVNSFVEHLQRNPMDIPAFQIRDIQIPFGDSITPIEIISATLLLKKDD